MSYHLDFSKQAENDIDFHKKSGNKSVLKKMLVLLNEIVEHPFDGTGKPELLKHNLTGCWSRRINHEHRIIYQVTDNKVLIHSLKGHY
jgi:toxin YoeB